MFNPFQEDTAAFVMAVSITFERFEVNGKKPGSDEWLDFPWKREEIVSCVKEEWASLLDCDARRFHYPEWFVCDTWKKWRKAKEPDRKSDKQIMREILGIENKDTEAA